MILLLSIMASSVAQAVEILKETQSCLRVYNFDTGSYIQDGSGSSALNDRSQTTKVTIPDTELQAIEFEWYGCATNSYTVNAVLIETDESVMTSGTIEFYVWDDTTFTWTECPDTNGVGTDGKGGVFNCGLTGSYLQIKCTTPCSPNLSIVEVVLHTEEVVSIQGTPYYIGDADGDPSKPSDTGVLFGTGSYWFQTNPDNQFVS